MIFLDISIDEINTLVPCQWGETKRPQGVNCFLEQKYILLITERPETGVQDQG